MGALRIRVGGRVPAPARPAHARGETAIQMFRRMSGIEEPRQAGSPTASYIEGTVERIETHEVSSEGERERGPRSEITVRHGPKPRTSRDGSMVKGPFPRTSNVPVPASVAAKLEVGQKVRIHVMGV